MEATFFMFSSFFRAKAYIHKEKLILGPIPSHELISFYNVRYALLCYRPKYDYAENVMTKNITIK